MPNRLFWHGVKLRSLFILFEEDSSESHSEFFTEQKQRLRLRLLHPRTSPVVPLSFCLVSENVTFDIYKLLKIVLNCFFCKFRLTSLIFSLLAFHLNFVTDFVQPTKPVLLKNLTTEFEKNKNSFWKWFTWNSNREVIGFIPATQTTSSERF